MNRLSHINLVRRYDAYVVSGYAPKAVTLADQTSDTIAAMLPPPTRPAEPPAAEKKYAVRPRKVCPVVRVRFGVWGRVGIRVGCWPPSMFTLLRNKHSRAFKILPCKNAPPAAAK